MLPVRNSLSPPLKNALYYPTSLKLPCKTKVLLPVFFQGGSCAELQPVLCVHIRVCVCVGTNVHISGWPVQLTKPFAPGLRMTGTVSSFLRKFAPRCSVCKEPIMPAPGQEETVRIVALDRDFHVQCYRCEVGIPLTAGTESKGWLNFITTSCRSHDRNTLL